MPADDVDKFLSEQKSLEDRRKALIDAVLKERADKMKEYDERLAKLGYEGDGAKSRRSHHRKADVKEKAKP